MISDFLIPELRCLKSREDRAAVLSAALSHPASLLRFAPIELFLVAVLVFVIWLVAWAVPVPLSTRSRALIYLAGYLPVVAVVAAAITRNVRSRVVSVMFASGTELCAFCRYQLGEANQSECPECGRSRRQSRIINELRLADVEPIVPELYELCDDAEQASHILVRAKASMGSLWAARRFLIIASGAAIIIVAVIVAQVAGFYARGGSPERWIVIPGVALGFALPVVVHASVLRLLRKRFRERFEFERARGEKRRLATEAAESAAGRS